MLMRRTGGGTPERCRQAKCMASARPCTCLAVCLPAHTPRPSSATAHDHADQVRAAHKHLPELSCACHLPRRVQPCADAGDGRGPRGGLRVVPQQQECDWQHVGRQRHGVERDDRLCFLGAHWCACGVGCVALMGARGADCAALRGACAWDEVCGDHRRVGVRMRRSVRRSWASVWGGACGAHGRACAAERAALTGARVWRSVRCSRSCVLGGARGAHGCL